MMWVLSYIAVDRRIPVLVFCMNARIVPIVR